jgi:hypothetical protein
MSDRHEPHQWNEKAHDLRGNEVDGWYWVLLEDTFRESAAAFHAAGNDRAAVIAERLVATTDDVPAQLVQEQQDFWNCAADLDLERLGDVHDQMMEEIARGKYTPEDATVFVMEFIRRVTGATHALA